MLKQMAKSDLRTNLAMIPPRMIRRRCLDVLMA